MLDIFLVVAHAIAAMAAASVGLPAVLLCLYTVYIQHERGGFWNACWAAGILFHPMNLIVAHTIFPLLMWRKPRRREVFVSRQIAGMRLDRGWRGDVARRLASLLNFISPNGDHFGD